MMRQKKSANGRTVGAQSAVQLRADLCNLLVLSYHNERVIVYACYRGNARREAIRRVARLCALHAGAAPGQAGRAGAAGVVGSSRAELPVIEAWRTRLAALTGVSGSLASGFAWLVGRNHHAFGRSFRIDELERGCRATLREKPPSRP